MPSTPEDSPPTRSRLRPRRSVRVEVADESMLPTLRPGDRLRVDRSEYRERAPRVGEIVVFVDPEAPRRWLVKRVSAVDVGQRTIEVRGDNAALARDSRRFGPVPLEQLIGRAYRIYAPRVRRRDL